MDEIRTWRVERWIIEDMGGQQAELWYHKTNKDKREDIQDAKVMIWEWILYIDFRKKIQFYIHVLT